MQIGISATRTCQPSQLLPYITPPSNCLGSTDATCIDQLTDLLTTLQTKYNNIIILGDINMHMDDLNNQNACILRDSINAFDLTQHV